MEDLSLHILDIVENSINAGAGKVKIKITEDVNADIFMIEIKDNGKGMNKKEIAKVCDPFYTTKAGKRTGLGIPLLAQAVEESMGSIDIKTRKGHGCTITAKFRYHHIDRKPVGNISNTLLVLIASNPDIDFVFEYIKNRRRYLLNTAKIKREIDDIPINSPVIIKIIKDDISKGLINIMNMIQ